MSNLIDVRPPRGKVVVKQSPELRGPYSNEATVMPVEDKAFAQRYAARDKSTRIPLLRFGTRAV
ncbi:hypothetical protein MFFC18_31200 [Mariniblastus fucicola]|uniref:Uncharacterized protein n=1 Tax=Mariniblastus fucicola TaxID=980251 RepID=A0A5B9PAD3_9BACT|nr:hypothetical protein MFFC18_31200 [Mariniblastus fucicola]